MFVLLKKKAVWVLICSVLVLLSLSCDNKPTEPVESKDYLVYYWTSYGDFNLFAYHTKTFEIDSFSVPFDATNGISVSADGNLLYFSNNDSTTVVNAKTLEFVRALPYFCYLYNPITVSPDGNYIAISGQEHVILETTNYTEIYKDSSSNKDGEFSEDSRYYYYGSYQLDLGVFPSTKKELNISGNLFTARPSKDNSTVYFYQYFDNFVVYDLITDSILKVINLTPGIGDIIESKITDEIFASNPGNFYRPSSEIDFFSINKYSFTVDTVNTEHLRDENNVSFEAGVFKITPDGRYLIILSPLSQPPFRMIQYDIVHKEIVNYLPNLGGWIASIGIQKQI